MLMQTITIWWKATIISLSLSLSVSIFSPGLSSSSIIRYTGSHLSLCEPGPVGSNKPPSASSKCHTNPRMIAHTHTNTQGPAEACPWLLENRLHFLLLCQLSSRFLSHFVCASIQFPLIFICQMFKKASFVLQMCLIKSWAQINLKVYISCQCKDWCKSSSSHFSHLPKVCPAPSLPSGTSFHAPHSLIVTLCTFVHA